MSPKMWETCGKVILRKMPLSYLRGIFLRCLAESNRCSRFCRPVPNRSAKAPFPFWDCKYRYFYLICKIYFDKDSLLIRQLKLLYIQQESLKVFSFWMVDIYRVVAWLIKTVEDAYLASTLGCSREDCKRKGFFIDHLRTAICKY